MASTTSPQVLSPGMRVVVTVTGSRFHGRTATITSRVGVGPLSDGKAGVRFDNGMTVRMLPTSLTEAP